MKITNSFSIFIRFAPVLVLLFSSFTPVPAPKPHKFRLHFPYKKTGLSKEQAAAHLLSRFTYGATPELLDEVMKMGLEKWFMGQIVESQPDDSLNKRLEKYNCFNLGNADLMKIYKPRYIIRELALKDSIGLVNDSMDYTTKNNRALLDSYMVKKGYRYDFNLWNDFIQTKILRAAYTNNQVREILTDFWFNHFNVSFTREECQGFIPAYERDVIRPNVFGHFQDLLTATAKSPAMLMYLDNFTSSGINSVFNTNNKEKKTDKKQAIPATPAPTMEMGMTGMQNNPEMEKAMNQLMQNTKPKGLNENYAREIMELHTLGVDGGYTQQDVTQAARILTGWSVYPMNDYQFGWGSTKKLIDKIGEKNLATKGFVRDGDFLFTANRHDDGPKKILGVNLPAHCGYEEGQIFLAMLAHHPSTAKLICKKLAVRFVNDTPPQTLIDEMSKTFTKTEGDITAVLATMLNSKEFWSKESVREKVKSPFELTISAIRSLHADIQKPMEFFYWANRMGQKIYYYQAPTGFPDKGTYWINTGSLLNRMNFGLAIVNNRIPGVNFNLLALNKNHEPESPQAALETYAKLLLPGRDVATTIQRLQPIISQSNLDKKLSIINNKPTYTQVVQKETVYSSSSSTSSMDMMSSNNMVMASPMDEKKQTTLVSKKQSIDNPQKIAANNNPTLKQIVGVIIGSPEFQRK